MKPTNTTLLHPLTKLKEDAGDLERAFQLYKEILRISPDDEKAGEAYLRLRHKMLDKGKRVGNKRKTVFRSQRLG